MTHAYPPDLARYVESHWPRETPLRVPLHALERALGIAFHASLTVEEARPTRVRVLLTPPEDLPVSGVPIEGVLRLMFDHRRPFEVEELRRLAPAVPFETALVGVHEHCIWGVAHSGPAWLAPTWGGRNLVPNWTYDPIIHITGPGQLAVRCAGKLVGALERGVIVDALIDVFESAWLPSMFVRERDEVRVALRTPTKEVEHSLISRVSQHMLRRAIQLVRGAHQGGMILVVPDDLNGLRLKYRLAQDEPTHRFRSLLLQILAGVAAATSKASIGWSDFVASTSAELERLEQAVFEWSRVIANLALTDGAVLLDKRFGIVGFGVEVSGAAEGSGVAARASELSELPSPSQVWRALDTEGHARRPEEIESRGTRHRAAYRFVNDHPGALAIVISHDGGVSFVAKRDNDVMVWEQSVGP